MKNLIVTAEVLNELSPYQCQDRKLSIGDKLFVIDTKVACVRHREGYATTFSILTDGLPYKEGVEVNTDSYYNANRWSLNNKFKNLIK